LPAVADQQNTIVKEFEDNPDVVTIIYNVGGNYNEDLDWLLTLWDNYYMRGPVVFDVDASVAINYRQPRTGLPFGRGFIIDQNGMVDTPYFGHRPKQTIKRIYELLDTAGVPGREPGRDQKGSVILEQRGPNPFSASTTIRYELPERSRVELAIFDVAGRLVERLEAGWAHAGLHETVWNRSAGEGSRAASGVYFCRLLVESSGGFTSSGLKLVVLE
jgi:hypothetical protein